MFFLTSVKTKPTYRASLLREGRRSGLDGAGEGPALTSASTSGILPVGAKGMWGGARPVTRGEPRADRWWKGVGTGRAMGAPKASLEQPE